MQEAMQELGSEMFSDWENFYLIIGSSAGALIGIMFVVATLTAGLESRLVARGARVFFTPIVFHFAVVVVVSAIAVVPELPPPAVGVIVALCAAIGCAYSAATTIRIFNPGSGDPPSHWSDKYFYGFLPTATYLGLACAAGAVWLSPRGAAYAIGACMLALLLIGIRDSWDLGTYLLQKARDRRG
jgi:hypothetical protein